jgi:hypothetical protein
MTDVPLTIDELERWILFGAGWRVLEISSSGAEVEFRACTGEPVERRGTTDPAVIQYLRTAHVDQ